MATVLIIGDIMGRPGRLGLAQVLPLWKEQYQPDVVIGNVENLAHGKGVTKRTLEEMNDLGFDAYTSGNHIFDNKIGLEECLQAFPNIVRPGNYTGEYKSEGFYRFAKNNQQYLLINLSGRVFMNDQISQTAVNPFFAFDEIYNREAQKGDIIIVDLHAETTSEKNAFGWYVDGRATVVYGTHTHVPTSDTKILPKGTAYQTDIGMSGAKDSVIGLVPENSLELFLEKGKMRFAIPESGPVIVNGLLVELEAGQVVGLEQLQEETRI